MNALQVLEPLPNAYTSYYPHELTAQEKAYVRLLNRERGTLHLIDYRNSPDGKSDEKALKIELSFAYKHRNTNK